MIIDVEQPSTWSNLKKHSSAERKRWIKSNFLKILNVLSRYSSSLDAQKKPWDTIGYFCLDDGLYKEAENIYQDMAREYRHNPEILYSILYCLGISKFLQGRYKEAYKTFVESKQVSQHVRSGDLGAVRAINYIENTIFPMFNIVAAEKEHLLSVLSIPRFIDKTVGPNILKTLHKWNSCSSLYSTGISQGGGYLLTLKNSFGETKTIAIDPGYGFLDMFKELDLSIADLDVIIATHDHDDHTESIEPILSLLAKYNDVVPKNKVKSIDVFGSSGVMLKFQGLFNANDPYGSKEINFKLMVPGITIDKINNIDLMEKHGFIIHVKQAYHEELWTKEESSVGLVIETNLKIENAGNLKIGITGDSRYETGLGGQYAGCRVLMFNIGSLEKEEGKHLTQHLGLVGAINVLKESKPKIALLTEFGEEFRGKRATVASVIEDWAAPMEGFLEGEDSKVFPSDVHFELRLTDLCIKETTTKVFIPYNLVDVNENQEDVIMYSLRENGI